MELNLSMNTSDYECREYLASIRWKNGFTCPRCGCAEAWETKEVKYKCKKCGYKMSVTAGTIFQDSHTPLEKWFARHRFDKRIKRNNHGKFSPKQIKIGQ